MVAVMLLGCGNKKKKREYYIQRHELAAKYNALTENSDLDGYVYQLQKKIVNGNKLLCFPADVKELSRNDSTCTLRLKLWKSEEDRYYVADLKVSTDVADRLNEQLQNKEKEQAGTFLFHVSQINLDEGQATSSTNEEGDTYDYDVLIVRFKGELIDFFIYNKKADK